MEPGYTQEGPTYLNSHLSTIHLSGNCVMTPVF